MSPHSFLRGMICRSKNRGAPQKRRPDDRRYHSGCNKLVRCNRSVTAHLQALQNLSIFCGGISHFLLFIMRLSQCEKIRTWLSITPSLDTDSQSLIACIKIETPWKIARFGALAVGDSIRTSRRACPFAARNRGRALWRGMNCDRAASNHVHAPVCVNATGGSEDWLVFCSA
jgi:hypothetical protein